MRFAWRIAFGGEVAEFQTLAHMRLGSDHEVSYLQAARVSSVPIPAVIQVTNTFDSGRGSLRAALELAGESSQDKMIEVSPSGVIRLLSALPSLRGNVQVVGPGAEQLTISGNYQQRVFTIETNAVAKITGITVAEGRSQSNAHGGGIANAGTLVVSNCIVRDCSTRGGFGGGIFNSGSLVLLSSTVCSNRAVGQSGGNAAGDGAGGGGGGAGLGGGLFCAAGGSAAVTNCTFSANEAVGGVGGDVVPRGGLNYTGGHGGGPEGGVGGGVPSADGQLGGFGSGGGGGGGALGLPGGNGGRGGFGGGGGGAAKGAGQGTDGAPGLGGFGGGPGGRAWSGFGIEHPSGGGGGGAGLGGGVFVDSGAAVGLVNCTVSGNRSDGGHGGAGSGFYGGGEGGSGGGIGGGIFCNASTVALLNTLIAGNFASTNSPDAYGSYGSLGHNLVRNSTGATGFGATDLLEVDANLGYLKDSGGQTWTHALLQGNAAVDGGTASGAPAVDQRGVPRPQGMAVDIGAFEATPELWLTMPEPVATATIRLRISGSVPGCLLLRSTNLLEWAPIATNSAAGSLWTIDLPQEGERAQFYRAVFP